MATTVDEIQSWIPQLEELNEELNAVHRQLTDSEVLAARVEVSSAMSDVEEAIMELEELLYKKGKTERP